MSFNLIWLESRAFTICFSFDIVWNSIFAHIAPDYCLSTERRGRGVLMKNGFIYSKNHLLKINKFDSKINEISFHYDRENE